MKLKSFIIKPGRDITLERLIYNIERISHADNIYLDFDLNDKYCLINLGMLFALEHYSHKKKNIIELKKIQKTPKKSFNNVILDIIEKVDDLPEYKINKEKVFLISPVREADHDLILAFRKYKKHLLKSFYDVHFPFDDTDQNDTIGTRICKDNLQAEAESGIIKLFYDKKSKGSVFDLGMSVMLKYHLDKQFTNIERKIEIINKQNIKGEDFYEKFLLNLYNENRKDN